MPIKSARAREFRYPPIGIGLALTGCLVANRAAARLVREFARVRRVQRARPSTNEWDDIGRVKSDRSSSGQRRSLYLSLLLFLGKIPARIGENQN